MFGISRGRSGSLVRAALLPVLTLAVACTRTTPPPANGAASDTNHMVASSKDELLLAAAKVALPPPGIQPADLPSPNAPAAKDLVTYCTTCHDLPTPLLHSATDWPGVVRRMWLRMDRIAPKYAVPVPDAGQRLVLLRYLTDNALKVSGATLPAGEGKELFEKTCSRCHDLPDPRQHSAQDWVAVVERMSQRSGQMLGQVIDQPDVTRISLYLEGIRTPKK